MCFTHVDALLLGTGEELLQQMFQVRRFLRPPWRVVLIPLFNHGLLRLQDLFHLWRHDL
jgi:hypothetical protein